MYQANLDDNLLSLMRKLKDGTFEPRPLRVLSRKGFHSNFRGALTLASPDSVV
jgi:hypothetical protein